MKRVANPKAATVERLEKFVETLKAGKPIKATVVTRQPKAAKAKRLYEIKPLVWKRDGSVKTLFGYYRVNSVDYWGKWCAYGCRRIPWPTYSCLGKHKTKEGARAIAERVYQQQLRRALRECAEHE